jgi:predicted transposase/invertase (TIGR01784 family)
VFTKETPQARGALSRLVSALIDRNVTINSIWANEPPINSLTDRKMRFDINCRAENGERINVEMGFDPKPYEPVRLEYHAGRLFTGQEISGGGRGFNDLKRTYQIAILARKNFFADDEFLHTFEYFDPTHQVPLNGRTRIITVELSKLRSLVEKPTSSMNEAELWAVYIEYLTDKSKRVKINEILEKEEGIFMAHEVLSGISRDEDERMRLYIEEKHAIDYHCEMTYYQREGMKEGLKEGRAEGRKDVINLVKSGKTLEEIIRDYSDE